jgi:hypothetical protein
MRYERGTWSPWEVLDPNPTADPNRPTFGAGVSSDGGDGIDIWEAAGRSGARPPLVEPPGAGWDPTTSDPFKLSGTPSAVSWNRYRTDVVAPTDGGAHLAHAWWTF